MERRPRLCAAALAGALLAAGSGPAAPLPARNLSPTRLLFLEPLLESPDTLAVPQTVGLDLAYATVCARNDRGDASARFDLEIGRADLRWGARLGARWDVEVDAPFLWTGGGAFDGALIGYHEALGLPGGNRRDAPRNRYAWSVRTGDRTFAPGPGGGLGDVVVRLKAAAVPGLAARALLKLPTGSAGAGRGSGAADAGLGGVFALRRGPLELSGALDGLYLGGSPSDALPLATPWALSAALAAGASIWKLPELTVQVQYFSTPYDTGLPAVDRDAIQLAAGVSGSLGGRALWAFGFTEDASVNTAPDFSLFARLEWPERP